MAIEFSELAKSARLVGDDVVEMPAGQHLKVETTPAGEELLDYEIPAGKVGAVTVYVEVVLSDA